MRTAVSVSVKVPKIQSLRPLVGNGRYKSRKKADETVIILEPYTILFRICSGGRNFASNGCCLLPLSGIYDSGPEACLLNFREGVSGMDFDESGAIETAV